MIAHARNIEYCEKVRRLPRGEEHSCRAALQLTNLRRDGITGGILQTGIKISARFKVEQFPHVLAGSVFKSSALNDGYLTGFSVAGGIAALYAFCFYLMFVHIILLTCARVDILYLTVYIVSIARKLFFVKYFICFVFGWDKN